IGWYHYGKVSLLNLESRELKHFSTSHHFTWELNKKYALLRDHRIIDLSTLQEIKVKSIILGKGGAAFIQNGKWRFAGDQGIIDLEESAQEIFQPSQQLTGRLSSEGKAHIVGQRLILTSLDSENIYNVKTGELLSRKLWADPNGKTILHTDNSRIILRNGRAYIYSNTARKLPVSPVVTSTAKVDDLFWQKVPRDKWLNLGNNQAPEMTYRLQQTSETLHLQVKLKNSSEHMNGLALSLNSLRFDHGIYAYKIENSLGYTSIENTPFDQLIEHYFDNSGGEFFEFKVSKTELMKNDFQGHLQFEIFAVKDGIKTGTYRISGCYAPKLNLLLPNPPVIEHVISKAEYDKLTELYSLSTSFVGDGRTLSKYVKMRRLLYGFDNTISFLEHTLKRQAKSTTAIAVLAALMLEKVELQRGDNLSDKAIMTVERECRDFARSLKINNDWIDNALTFIDMDFIKGQNNIALPHRAGINDDYYMNLCGTYQFSATDGRILFPLGFLADPQLSKIHRLQIHRDSKFPTAMGKVNLFKQGRFTELIAENGQANKAMVHSSWQNEYEKVYNFTGEEKKQAWAFKWSSNLPFTKLNQVLIERQYHWTEEALLDNLRLNPVSEPIAARLLKKWLYISKVEPEKFSEVCMEIIANDRTKLNLILGVVTIFREHTQDMEQLKNLLSKAKVPLSIRRQVFMRHVEVSGWKVLGPIDSATQSDEVELSPMPEETTDFKTATYKNDQGTFKFTHVEKMKRNNSGTAYFTKSFTSTKTRAYLHIDSDNANSLDQIKIWINGALVDGTMDTGSSSIKSFLLPL
ncbi:MAG: hypothetical protein HRT88_19820, partial [Lentisphaeraceae bacterium]|nr:hypothetical protein [Lentisphaeraceae bacterium]